MMGHAIHLFGGGCAGVVHGRTRGGGEGVTAVDGEQRHGGRRCNLIYYVRSENKKYKRIVNRGWDEAWIAGWQRINSFPYFAVEKRTERELVVIYGRNVGGSPIHGVWLAFTWRKEKKMKNDKRLAEKANQLPRHMWRNYSVTPH